MPFGVCHRATARIVDGSCALRRQRSSQIRSTHHGIGGPSNPEPYWLHVNELYRADFGDNPLTADESQGLMPSLTTQRELNEFEFANILSGRKWALSPRRIAKGDVLNVSYLLELHRQMFDATWRWAGKIRTTENTIGVLLGDVSHWISNKVYPSDDIAIRFHHRLVFIHPFSNGNGRHSRLASDVLALKLGRPIFPWGGSAVDGDARRKEYLAALRCADGTDYGPLILFARGTATDSPPAAPST
jgi:Fic-DOC domain mobile mystery protein B